MCEKVSVEIVTETFLEKVGINNGQKQTLTCVMVLLLHWLLIVDAL